MGVLYLPFFDVTEVSTLGAITFATAGKPDFNVDLSDLTATTQADSGSSSIFAHYLGTLSTAHIYSGEAATLYFTHYARTTLGAALEAAIETAATAQAWTSPSGFSVSFSTSTGKYTIAYPTANFTMTFANAVTRNMLGYSGTQSGAMTYTGTKTPLYCCNASLGDVSEESTFYEPDGIGNHLMTDGGRGGGTSRTEAPKYKTWVQEYETKLKTFRVYGAQPDGTNDPFTFEHLFEYCRGNWPFGLFGGDRSGNYGVNEIYYLRTEGIAFNPKRASPGNDAQFHIPFEVVLAGVVDGVIS